MSLKAKAIPIYATDGSSRGCRSLEAAQRLIDEGLVTGVYGRKGHLRAIFTKHEDGACPVELHLKVGRRYSFREHLASGHFVWALKRVDNRDGLRADIPAACEK